MSLLPPTQVPFKARARDMVEEFYSAKPLRNVYVNGGVLLAPAGVGFDEMWRKYVREIAELFGNPSKSVCVCGCNMAALAMTITVHAKFDGLDL